MLHHGLISALVAGCRFITLTSVATAASAQELTTPVLREASFPAVASHYSHETDQSLSQRGFSLHSTFVHDLSKSPFSAHSDDGWFARYSLDFSMDVDGQKAMHWNGATFHLDLKRHANVAGRLYRDVTQGYSNIDADSRLYLYEAWALESIGQDRLEIELGQIDANSRFANVATAADFLNSSMGYSPTIRNFPTYPHPKPGVEASVNLPASYRITGGEFQTDSGRMALAQAEEKWTLKSAGVPGEAEFGYWRLRDPMTMRNGELPSGSHGYYAVVEQSIWRPEESGDGGSARKLAAFLQLGTEDGRENGLRAHLGYGVVFRSPFSRRPGDAVGVAATRVRAGDSDNSIRGESEFVSEEYYKLALKSGVALIVDAQYFVNPGAGAHSPPFLVLTPRIVFTF